MTLLELVDGLPVEMAEEQLRPPIEVTGIAHDSRRARPGDLFVAWHGDRFDGRAFAADAITRGAVAVLADSEAPFAATVPWLRAREPRRLLAPLAARVYAHPDRELRLVGVTGTNGKTTVTMLVAAMLARAGYPCGVLGTLGTRFGTLELPSHHTTPEGNDFFSALRAMRDAGAAAATCEVSSHALDQGRVASASFEVAVFTNLTRDHFDYHGDFDRYFAAKRLLFTQLRPGGRAVLPADDPYGQRLAAELERPLIYGESTGDVSIESAELSTRGTAATIRTPRGRLAIESRLLGRFNLSNVLAAVGAAEALELEHDAIREAVSRFSPVCGRMEPIEAGQDFPALVDYAHTEGGLEAVLGSLREIFPGRIAVVCGAGGERDTGKRPRMGAAAARGAELVLVTDDNPRREDPAAIRAAILEGARAAGAARLEEVGDRRAAIRRAVEIASSEPGWLVLVAGKGHERVQILGDRELPFSDQAELLAALGERLGTAAAG
ncbi:MAG TPA: UDP-N-acetylmuramoyl-L-alanyl-D-glutamate--2,6-diaminopimelate ligase [Thermoanaerobaculia bacterium]|nr:UDP-N-acetylmuramoyl-L-alanyl-D-glutamate--2,6-diaminopimelate ligase [Thermoanaerobaculia bacterium]